MFNGQSCVVDEHNGGWNLLRGSRIATLYSSRQRIDIFDSSAYGLCIFLDGELQVAQNDERLYHSFLSSIVMSRSRSPLDVLILGGGDACCARELEREDGVRSIRIVDFDSEFVRLCHGWLGRRFQVGHVLSSKKVAYTCADIRELRSNDLAVWTPGAIIVDLTDNWTESAESVLHSIENYFSGSSSSGILVAQFGATSREHVQNVVERTLPPVRWSALVADVPVLSYSGTVKILIAERTGEESVPGAQDGLVQDVVRTLAATLLSSTLVIS